MAKLAPFPRFLNGLTKKVNTFVYHENSPSPKSAQSPKRNSGSKLLRAMQLHPSHLTRTQLAWCRAHGVPAAGCLRSYTGGSRPSGSAGPSTPSPSPSPRAELARIKEFQKQTLGDMGTSACCSRCIYIYMYIYIYIFICAHMHADITVYMYIYICLCVCMPRRGIPCLSPEVIDYRDA